MWAVVYDYDDKGGWCVVDLVTHKVLCGPYNTLEEAASAAENTFVSVVSGLEAVTTFAVYALGFSIGVLTGAFLSYLMGDHTSFVLRTGIGAGLIVIAIVGWMGLL